MTNYCTMRRAWTSTNVHREEFNLRRPFVDHTQDETKAHYERATIKFKKISPARKIRNRCRRLVFGEDFSSAATRKIFERCCFYPTFPQPTRCCVSLVTTTVLWNVMTLWRYLIKAKKKKIFFTTDRLTLD